MKVASQLRVPASVLGEGISGTNIIGDLVDPRTFLQAVEKKMHPPLNQPRVSSSRSLNSLLTKGLMT